MDVSLVPLHEMHHQRYTVYWRLLSDAEWLEEKAAQDAETRRQKQLEARTVDLVTPTGDVERAHNQQGKSTYSGAAFGRRWRDARGGGWFSYDMKVSSDHPVELIVTYWGSDVGNRVFDILVEGKKIATQKLDRIAPDEFIDVIYKVPAELTQAKKKVTVKFQGHAGSMAGGVFACRIVRRME